MLTNAQERVSYVVLVKEPRLILIKENLCSLCSIILKSSYPYKIEVIVCTYVSILKFV